MESRTFWTPTNNGAGKRPYFITRTVDGKPEYHENTAGDVIRYSAAGAARKAAELNAAEAPMHEYSYGDRNDTAHYVWSVGPMGDAADHLGTYCRDCAQTLYGHLSSAEVEIVPDVNHDETDSPGHCSNCDLLLDLSLTSEGYDYVRAAVMEALTLGNAIALDPDSITYEWFEKYGDGIDTDTDDILDPVAMLRAYLAAQVWTGTISWQTNTYEFGGEEYNADSLLDRYIDADELDATIVASSTEDVDNFINMIEPYLKFWELPESTNNGQRMDAAQMGHDFSLTRNHHGAGFWDRGYGELGDWLTRCAQSFGSASLYGSIVLDPAYATRNASGGLDYNIDHVLTDTLAVYLEG